MTYAHNAQITTTLTTREYAVRSNPNARNSTDKPDCVKDAIKVMILITAYARQST